MVTAETAASVVEAASTAPRPLARVSQTVSNTSQARWVNVPPVVFKAVVGLVAREDRHSDRRVF